jgi:hypothetical protein
VPDYRLWLNAERTVLVEVWPESDDAPTRVRVATRPHPDAVWGPPIQLTEERVS